MFELINKVAVITGAAQGIGFGIAKIMAKQGAHVVICDMNEEQSQNAAKELEELGYPKALGIRCNVTDIEDLENAMTKTVEVFGGIDILVNNAGVLHNTPILEVTEEEFKRQIDINLTGAFFAMQKALPYLTKSKAGRIVNIASVAGRMGSYASGMGYVSSKGGLISLTYGIARQYTQQGVNVNVICPGPIATDMVKLWDEETYNKQISRIPVGRFGTTDEIGALVNFLSSNEAGFISGACIDINGGMHIG